MSNAIALPSNRLIRFESFEKYFGDRIFKNFLLFSYIGLFLALVYIPFDYKMYGATNEFLYVLGGRLTAVFFAIMVIIAVAHPYFENRRIEAITTFGTMGFSSVALTYLLFGNPVHFVGYSWMFYLTATMMLAPLVTKKLYFIMESFQILFVLLVMGWIGKGDDEIVTYLFFSIPLAGYVFAVVILNRKNGVEAYKNAYENHILMSLDGLSNLLNRRTWYEVSSRHWDDDKGVSFIMLDIDHFKRVNDTYGHECGDRVIETVSGVLLDQTREQDLVGRLGGEEFGVILPQTDLNEATRIAERIRQKIEETPITYNDEIIRVTASIGIIENSEHINDFNTLVSLGDKHLYSAKEQGRNRICY
ncbi:MAG: GGDEF domain-containing protein [Sulfuricurvum sp.]|uniref:GGDEF domain-containing protein n=1 Tax=Sulfuricurvum sp. TaxID=2025608 RepID=UPI002611ED31|nr:GGDEF domain-containing protein [Sulfuricurvum sp.]MDD2828783.1 GGDEF domain-containing protein [Sulfuricurvum sp.]MDD4948758.1 GGDEF domain-containing protein [Sulfuricurvum sp.]